MGELGKYWLKGGGGHGARDGGWGFRLSLLMLLWGLVLKAMHCAPTKARLPPPHTCKRLSVDM